MAGDSSVTSQDPLRTRHTQSIVAAQSQAEAQFLRLVLRQAEIPYCTSRFAPVYGVVWGEAGLVFFNVFEDDIQQTGDLLDGLRKASPQEAPECVWDAPHNHGDEQEPYDSLAKAPFFSMVIIGILGGLIWLLEANPGVGLVLAVFADLLGGLAIASSFVLYLRAPYRRNLRYAMALAGSGARVLATVFMVLFMAGVPRYRYFFLWSTLVLLGALHVCEYYSRKDIPHVAENRRPMIFRAVMKAGAALGGVYLLERWSGELGKLPFLVNVDSGESLSFLLAPVILLMITTLPFYIIIRFHVVRDANRQPIVYLRSFRHPGASDAFHHVVAPVASEFGAIAAVRPYEQVGGGLVRGKGYQPRPREVELDESGWKATVRDLLGNCTVALIDVTRQTPGAWREMAEALRIVPHERICLLWSGEEPQGLPGDVDALEYAVEPQEALLESRRYLQEWFREVFVQPEPDATRS